MNIDPNDIASFLKETTIEEICEKLGLSKTGKKIEKMLRIKECFEKRNVPFHIVPIKKSIFYLISKQNVVKELGNSISQSEKDRILNTKVQYKTYLKYLCNKFFNQFPQYQHFKTLLNNNDKNDVSASTISRDETDSLENLLGLRKNARKLPPKKSTTGENNTAIKTQEEVQGQNNPKETQSQDIPQQSQKPAAQIRPKTSVAKTIQPKSSTAVKTQMKPPAKISTKIPPPKNSQRPTTAPQPRNIQDENFNRRNRTAIPKPIRNQVWGIWIGYNKKLAKCPLCNITNLDATDTHWECAHIKPIKEGGGDELNNLRPLCRDCNNAMGTENMINYCVNNKVYGRAALQRLGLLLEADMNGLLKELDK